MILTNMTIDEMCTKSEKQQFDRMYMEMKQAGLPEPEYRTGAFMVYATIKNKKFLEMGIRDTQDDTQDHTQDSIKERILKYCKEPRSKKEITEYLGYKDVHSIAKNHIRPLIKEGKLCMTLPEKPNSKNQKYVSR